ncbi:minor tail protein [Arthrobacter phage Kumotta]|uniref:Minor tail protein n=2 Tax=Kumottavirus TaxID=3044749 RepID=A0A4Y6ELD8_9CAUD|nr:minor tail protein [Arthrobacter phage Kumotta]YP_010649500.1 minor tail protein [Arthrobacter phage MargaretKali]AXH44398.1 minor tail protein [Arthrobacter phage MargaretKali]QDF19528.1 hypothetical protein SEA_KUMOTTA_18 [Arthrobacter phage Kumotta]
MGISYATPYRPPAPAVNPWKGAVMSWTAKGVTWPLTDPASGMFLMPGVRGLGSITTERHSTSSPAVPGSRHEGISVLDREVFWPVHIFHDGSTAGWVERDRAFWDGMDPRDTGVWEILLPDGSKRTLNIRFRDDGGHTFTYDPFKFGWQSYGITFVAERPFWEGQPMVRAWKNADYAPFFEPDGPHLFNIGSGAELSRATIDNLGDVESYASWFIDGDTTSASVGVGSQVVDVPFSVPAGKCLVIESDPERIGATMYDVAAGAEAKKPSERIFGVDLVNPVDRSADLGEADFAPVPAGAKVQLSLSVVGTGMVEARLPSLYRRAW